MFHFLQTLMTGTLNLIYFVFFCRQYENPKCESCPRFCRSYLYNGFVTDRQKNYRWESNNTEAASLQTQVS